MRGRQLLALLASLALMGGGVAHCTGYPRHVDPGQLALENPNPLQLFELYSSIYGRISVSDYGGARRLLEAAEGITAPAGTLKALEQYNLLIGSVIEGLNQTEVSLGEAYEHLRWLREALAEEGLAASWRQLRAANGTTVDLGTASTSLAGVLRYSPQKLVEGLRGLNRLIDELNAWILEGFEEVELIKAMRLEGLEETALVVSVSTAGPQVGSSVTVTGSLVGSGRGGLEGRVVGVFLEGERVGEAETGEGGAFKYPLRVPYLYVDRLRLRAEYHPGAEDRGHYAPSASNTVYLRPVFHTPVLAAEAPGVVYPGMGFQLSGRLMFAAVPLEGVAVRVSYLGSTYSAVSGGDGCFRVNMFTPEETREGLAGITVSSAPRGVLGPASVKVEAQVARAPLELTYEKPVLVLSGWDAVVRGAVRSGGAPLQGCSVRLMMEEKTVEAVSNANGEFALNYPVSVLALSSLRVFEVAATPAEPWVSAEAVSSELLIVNSLVAAAPLLAVAAALRRRKARLTAGSPVGVQAPEASPTAFPTLPGFSGAYVNAVVIVSRVSGLRLRANYTMREYLRAVKPRLAAPVYYLFERVSSLYERWFYGGRGSEPPLDDAKSMVKELRDRVEEGPA